VTNKPSDLAAQDLAELVSLRADALALATRILEWAPGSMRTSGDPTSELERVMWMTGQAGENIKAAGDLLSAVIAYMEQSR
jgi:hypothetical protein